MKIECKKWNEIIVEHGGVRIMLEAFNFSDGTAMHVYLNPGCYIKDAPKLAELNEQKHFVIKGRK